MFERLKMTRLLVLLMLTASAQSAVADEVINAGVGGNRTTHLLKRIDRDVLARKPTVVVLMVGTNDRLNSGGFVSAADYRRNLESLVERIEANSASVLLITPPPCLPKLLFTRHDPKKFASQSPAARMEEVQQMVIELAKRRELPLVDFHQHLIEKKIADDRQTSVLRNMANSGAKDGVHLTSAGYRLLAELVANKLKSSKFDTSKTVCLGDSLTKGSSAANYPEFLDALLNSESN